MAELRYARTDAGWMLIVDDDPLTGVPVPTCPDCDRALDSFACKIRHVSVNVENLKRSR